MDKDSVQFIEDLFVYSMLHFFSEKKASSNFFPLGILTCKAETLHFSFAGRQDFRFSDNTS